MVKQKEQKGEGPIHHRGIPTSGVWHGRGGILALVHQDHKIHGG